MSFYTTGISISRIDEVDLGLVVTAHTVHTDKAVQCYVSGDLAAWQRPQGGAVRFTLQQARPSDTIVLLAVDAGEESVDYWSRASQSVQRHGGRLHIRTPRTTACGPGDVWRVRRSEAGETPAGILLREEPVYAGGRRCCGWGFGWGAGGWGFDAGDAAGWGHGWGHDWGLGADMLEWITEPLPRGTYRVEVALADAHGNESPALEAAAVVDTFARPASGLAVESYTKQTDTLVLRFTASEDL